MILERVASKLQHLGVNWAWGLLNFTVGSALGGTWVAIALVMHGAVR
jgi:hypothetical protein